MIEYQLISSNRRKTLSLQVKHGQVIVRAPSGIKKQFVDDVVDKKSAWLLKKIAEQANLTFSGCTFKNKDFIFIFGEPTRLKISTGVLADIHLYAANDINSERVLELTIANRIFKKLNSEHLLAAQVKKQLEQWLKKQAEHYIDTHIVQYINQTGLQPESIKVRQYRARWGSCNSKGELSFNYLLMLTPAWVTNYVVVHELCHLKYLNHSPFFWRLVEQHFPEYEQAKSWLKQHQSQLVWQLTP